eukprot:GFUD01044710.1.p1 GENE.GFUD01044710.1~~GFUD01044710.1.p1  ORF type:complete len:619 (+),score=153.32 GFUD01044710.1:28-1857(+)
MAMRQLVFVILGLACSFVHGSNNTGIFDCLTGPCVTVPGVGKLQGSKRSTQWTNRDVYTFMGIPFGEDTSGEHRFAPPRPKAPLNDGKDAFDATYLNYLLDWWDHSCPQPGAGATGYDNPMLAQWAAEHPERASGLPTGPTIGTEDCLHLAVFTPELPSASSNPKLPVMVYIHGGSFMLGGYIGAGPGKLLERDMIIVEMQYRVGPLGFMCLPDDEIAGNMGLLDQNLALKWVNEHITYFGGDPDRVTIMGESAGSASVTYHMISPLSQPYFQQAIAESGSALSSWAFDSDPEKHAKEIAGANLGCPTDTISGMVNCLKNEKTAADIVIAHKKYYKKEREEARMGFGGSVPCAQRNGQQKFITKHPKQYLMDAINAEAPSTKKAIFGANKHEGSFVLGMIYNSFILPNGVVEDTHFLRYLFSATLLEALGLKDDSGVIYELINYRYFEDSMLGDWDLMIDGMVNLVGTFFIKASTYEFMKYNQLAGAEQYLYSFEHYGEASLWNFLFPGNEQPPIPRGVTHGDELIYLFSTGVFNLNDEDWEVARIMSNLWANFVIYGNPTPPEFPVDGVPTWPLWHDQDKKYLTIDSTPEVHDDYIMTWETPDIYNNQ